MAENPLFLTTKDRALIQRFLEKSARTPPPLHSGPSLGEDSQAPEVYIARAPSGGIDAMVGAIPGRATCSTVQLLKEDSPSLISAAPTQEVYNISYSAVQPFAFGIINRDKFGAWVWVYTLAQTSDTEGFTGCRTVYNPCIPAYESWHYVDGLLMVIDFEVCEECDTDLPSTGTGTGTGTDTPCGCPSVRECYTVLGLTGITNENCDGCVSELSSNIIFDILYSPTDPCAFLINSVLCINQFDTTSLSLVVSANRYYFEVNRNGTIIATYENLVPGNCTTARVLTKTLPVSTTDSLNSCSNWPPTLTVREGCDNDTGTGTADTTTGTGTAGGIQTPCSTEPVKTDLVLTVVSNCSGAASPRALTYAGLLGGEHTWKTVEEGAERRQWWMRCGDGLGANRWSIAAFCGGSNAGEITFTPLSSSPFDSGDIALALSFGDCCGGSLGPTVRVTE